MRIDRVKQHTGQLVRRGLGTAFAVLDGGDGYTRHTGTLRQLLHVQI